MNPVRQEEVKQELTRKDLKIQALLEKVSSLTSNYENVQADHRVEITLLTQRVEELERENELLSEPTETPTENPDEAG